MVGNRRMVRWMGAALSLALVFAVPAVAGQNRDSGPSVAVIGLDDDGPHVIAHDLTYTVAGGERGPFLGVWLEEATDSDEGGARITAVADGSPAENAGLRRGDVIVEMNGRAVRGPGALTKRIAEMEVGDELDLEVMRDGGRMDIEVALVERPNSYGYFLRRDGDGPKVFSWSGDGDVDLEDLPEELREHMENWNLGSEGGEYLEHLRDFEGLKGLKGLKKLKGLNLDGDNFRFRVNPGRTFSLFGSRPVLGVQLVETTAELREHLGSDPDEGVLVSKVMSGMPAERFGVEVGDLITAVDGRTIGSSGDLIGELQDKHGETVRLDIVRDGRNMTIDVDLPEVEDHSEGGGPRA